MSSVVRRLRAWWHVLELGSARHLGANFDEIFRYHILQTLSDEGFFDYLAEPRNYGQILAHFGYTDSDYARDLFDVLVNDQRNVLIEEDSRYRLNPAQPLPTLEEVSARTDKRYQGFNHMAVDMVRNIPRRLRGQPVEFTEGFEAEGREMLKNFDKLLSLRLYTVSRNAAFAFLERRERAWLRGKTLLELGCGAGRETVELWLHLGGDVRMTAIDPVAAMLERANQRLPALLDEIDPDHPPLTDANRPVFKEASAARLPFDDDRFDAAFYAYILHYTPDPRRVVREIVRVVKPDGLIFGVQIMKPYWSPHVDMVIRSNENSHGFFWREEHRQWYAENGFDCETVTPLGVFRACKQERPQPAA
ncbi:MAG: hypothetical protein BMS9Abin28_1607 [Anaerolineae bacterium]|nr:MAG: hypothetical protein BMS9Abin28_1607 [Anaerolineae bacterium]